MERVGVVGCGLMGSGIAEVASRAGADVVVIERDREAVAAGQGRIERSLSRAVASGKLPEAEADAARARTWPSPPTSRAWPTASSSSRRSPRTRRSSSRSSPPSTPSSPTRRRCWPPTPRSIPIIKLAMATKRPEQVIGMHFFNPVPVLKLVEVISSLLTSAETTQRVRDYATGPLGKKVITSPDRAGFVVNALLIPYLLSAIRMLESGFASAEDIDTGMVVGCAHPLGPLALTDLIGLDTTLAVAESLYDEFKEPHLAPPPLLSRMTQAGLLGRKTGQGFYSYKA